MSLSKITYQMWYNHPSSLQIETTKRVGSGEWFLLGVQGHQAMKACMSRQFLTTIIYSDHHQKNQALLEIPNNFLFNNLPIIQFLNSPFSSCTYGFLELIWFQY